MADHKAGGDYPRKKCCATLRILHYSRQWWKLEANEGWRKCSESQGLTSLSTWECTTTCSKQPGRRMEQGQSPSEVSGWGQQVAWPPLSRSGSGRYGWLSQQSLPTQSFSEASSSQLWDYAERAAGTREPKLQVNPYNASHSPWNALILPDPTCSPTAQDTSQQTRTDERHHEGASICFQAVLGRKRTPALTEELV